MVLKKLLLHPFIKKNSFSSNLIVKTGLQTTTINLQNGPLSVGYFNDSLRGVGEQFLVKIKKK